MVRTMKKIMSIMLALVMMVSVCSISTFAASTPDSDFVYTNNGNGTIEISSYTGDDTNVVIPSTIDGFVVVSIGNSAFFGNDYITSVTIPCYVKSIGNYAFAYCSSLEYVTIPSAVNSISQSAFNNCPSDLVINCFTGSTAASYVQNNGIDYIRFSSVIKEDGTVEITAIGGTAKEVIVPSRVNGVEVTSIGDMACIYSNITSLTIPNGVTDINDYAFCQCHSLKSVTLPDSLKNIGDYAFAYCSSLESIEIPDGVKMIGSFAFGKCSSLESIVIPDSVENLFDYTFYCCSSLKSAVLPANEKYNYLESYVFAECTSLTEVTIPANIIYIFDEAFEGCSNLSVIYGDTGTIAQTFAEQNGISFVSLNN